MRRFMILSLALLCLACQSRTSEPKSEGPRGGATALLSGSVELDPSVLDRADPLAVLFIIARNEQGQIAAVKKWLPPFQFPLEFSLDAGDVMIAGTELSGKLKVTARLDKDGNANPAQSGDILGKTESEWVTSGDREVRIRLQELVP